MSPRQSVTEVNCHYADPALLLVSRSYVVCLYCMVLQGAGYTTYHEDDAD